jgi:two-component system NarL family sensor kinase
LAVSDKGKRKARELLMQTRDRRNGVGISGMRERVEQLEGYLLIECNDEGTTVNATVPMEINFHE